MDLGWRITLAIGSLLTFGAVGLGVWRLGPVWDHLAERRLGELSERFRRLSLDLDSLRLAMRIWGVALFAGMAILGPWLGAYPLAAVYLWLAWLAPGVVLDSLIRRRMRLLRDQLAVASLALANSVKAGLTLAQGLEAVSRETPDPLAAELRRIVREFQRGRPLKEAVEETRRRLDLEPFTLFATAIETALEQGGRSNTALERISASLIENQRLERKLEADTATGRQVVILLAAFPLMFLGLFFVLDPAMTSLLFTQLIGQVVLAAVFVLIYVGARWAARVMTMEV